MSFGNAFGPPLAPVAHTCTGCGVKTGVVPRSTFYPVEKYVRPVINANVSIKGSSMILLIGRSSCTLLRACLQLLPASVNPRLTASNRGLDVTLVSVTAACTNIQPSTVSWQCVWKYARESFFDVIHRQWRPWPCRRPSSPPPIYII